MCCCCAKNELSSVAAQHNTWRWTLSDSPSLIFRLKIIFFKKKLLINTIQDANEKIKEKEKGLLTMQASVHEDLVLRMLFLHQPTSLILQSLLLLAHHPTWSSPALPQPPHPTNAMQSHLPPASCWPGPAVNWLSTGLASGGPKRWDPDQLQLPRPSSLGSWTPCFPHCFLLHPPWLLDQMSWSIPETGRGTAWLCINDQTLENRLYECLTPPGVLERSKWEWVEDTCLFEMPTPTQVTGLCCSPGRYRRDTGKGQVGWGNTAHLMGRHPSACKRCHP